MKRWFTHNCPFPRWLIMLLIVLSTAAFVLTYAQTDRLDDDAHYLSVRLREAQSSYPLRINSYSWPVWGSLRYPVVQAGLACTLLALAGLFWGLCRARRSPVDNRPPITNHQSPITDNR